MAELPIAVQQRLVRLPRGLQDHVERVRVLAGDLAMAHGIERDIVDLAAAAHDLARASNGETLLDEARRFRIRIHPVERRVPALLHGRVAALWLENDDAVSDGRVLEAVRWHTTGKTDMDPVAKVVFVADKLEPEKVSHDPGLEHIMADAYDSLDQAILELVDHQIARLIRSRDLIHPASLKLRNDLISGLA